MQLQIMVYPKDDGSKDAASITVLNNDVVGIHIEAESIEVARGLFEKVLPEALGDAEKWTAATDTKATETAEGRQTSLNRAERMEDYANTKHGQRLLKRIETADKFLKKNAERMDLPVLDGMYLADGALTEDPYQFISWAYALGLKAGNDFANREAKRE